MGQAKMQSRLALGAEPRDGRRDFATYMLGGNREGERGINDSEVTANSYLLIAGGKIHVAFQMENEIDINRTERLEYLHAVIKENL
ncbi:hypothetical protein F4801DRAFT_582777 [Xylaria longipes]|nr:hypothetical protein F4801DRAFT_582777 [Xylaria longipes]